MAWRFNSEAPIYMQIMDEIKLRIARGILKPGDRILSVREFAIMAGVNPNTMQKALYELEREGVLETRRTTGRFVAEIEINEGIRNDIAAKHIKTYVDEMRLLGYEDDKIVSVVMSYLEYGGYNNE